MSEENSSEWQEPPPPEKIAPVETAEMSEIGTLSGIFFEPGRTFEDLRKKPRFLLAGFIIILLVSLFQFLYIQKIGFERIVRDRIETGKSTRDMAKDQRETIIQQQSGPIVKAISYGAVPIVMVVVFLIGGLIYWAGSNAMGGSSSFTRGIAVWVYSSLPPTLLFTVTNILVLFIKNLDDIDVGSSQQGLIQANPGFFIDGKTQPVLHALLGSLDLFAIIGWVLAAIGLQKVGRISSGAAWALVLILALVGVTFKVVGALIFGG